MDVRLPYSKKKRYLTGMDWTIAALNRMTRRFGGVSNASQIVLELQGPFSETALRGTLQTLPRELPVLHGHPARDWNLAPYWRTPSGGTERPLRLEVRSLEQAAPEAVTEALTQAANSPFTSRREHVVFRLYHLGAERHVLAMTFDHGLFDAQGAEAFLNLVQCRRYGDCSERLRSLSLTEPAHLSDWKRKFDCGRQLVRAVRAMTQARLRILPRPPRAAGRKHRFRVMPFSVEESTAILDAAYRQAGYLLTMPYTLATAVQLLDRVFRARDCRETDTLASVSIDMRTQQNAAANVFFNHVSFLFFRLAAEAAADRKTLIQSINRQMYDQVKARFPQALAESSFLMRIAPLSLLSRLMLLPLKGEFATFCFSHIGRSAYTFPRFMDAEVVNLFHMPLVPMPPGISFALNHFNGRFNAVLSYFDGILSETEASAIEQDARRMFPGG